MQKYDLGWGITNYCNMNCKFCYSKDVRKNVENINICDWKKFVDENHELIESINYGTGENTISDDFFEFVEYVRKNYPSIKQSLTTNGYLYERVNNNKRLRDIYIDCIDEVDVSLDFCQKDLHNDFRGQPKAYDWAINTLNMLKKDKKKATIVFVGFNETMFSKNIEGLFAIAKKFDALVRMNIYRPVGQNDDIKQRFKLSYNVLKDGLEYIFENYDVISLSDTLMASIYSENQIEQEKTGTTSLRILPEGTICPSTYLIDDKYRSTYNIKQANVLQYVKFDDFIDPIVPEECKDCELVNKCKGGVYDRRILWNDTLNSRDPYCPFENNDVISDKKVRVLKKERVSVHDGYLPTMFFKNRGD